MKAVFIAYNQAHTEQVNDVLNRMWVRGFTRWEQGVQGRGTNKGEPHYGNHAWPATNTAVLAMVEDDRVQPLLDALREVDAEAEQIGLRAFVWNVEGQI
jgi:nitrogen regulatory protein PII